MCGAESEFSQCAGVGQGNDESVCGPTGRLRQVGLSCPLRQLSRRKRRRHGKRPCTSQWGTQSASDGELFWYITKGDAENGMPSWETLSPQERWQIVSFIRVLGGSKPGSPRVRISPGEAAAAGVSAPPPQAPFTDYRFEKPGTFRKITLNDLPAPFATSSAGNGPEVVPRPENAWPQVPPGFKVELYTTGLDEPRLIRTAPNGDIFVAESRPGQVRVFRGITAEGKPGRRRFSPPVLSSLLASTSILRDRIRSGSM